ncbi:glycosyltransferase [Acholeplasma sp. OttesenSCG-928-E16]|nr:glycosyltransferase [Acholeplasma sp. OttesenSCG-928-E16]
MKLISIVIPFYYGNKYIEKTISSINEAIKNSKIQKNFFEIIIINDSKEEVVLNEQGVDIYINEQNLGIHESRIRGIKKASGKYILLLDQDDSITKEAFCNINFDDDFDCLVSNGIYEYKDSFKLIYKNKRALRLSTNYNAYLYFRNQIISPGQCLIKKSSIPNEWFDNILKINGTDDFFLWLLMFKYKKTFKTNNQVTYVHHFTDSNVSSNAFKMYESEAKMIDILDSLPIMSKKEIKIIRKSSIYNYRKRKSLNDFLVYSIKHFGIFIRNIYYLIKKA